MQDKEFNEIVEEQLEVCKSVLVDKAKEYAIKDRLSNFKTASKMLGVTNIEAIKGMMAKHLVSVFDIMEIVKDLECGNGFTNPKLIQDSVIDEKFTDLINYLLLAKACTIEVVNNKYKTDISI